VNRQFGALIHTKLVEENVEGPVHFMVPVSRNEKYIGLSKTRTHMREKDKSREEHSSDYLRLALWGLGGVG
jgi:hypothetical protein